MKKNLAIAALCVTACCSGAALAIEPAKIPDDLRNQSLKNEIELSVGRALSWFEKNQAPEGYWSTEEHPALTALVLSGFMRAPGGKFRADPSEAVKRGYKFVLGCARADGGIYKAELANYNTAICLTALLLAPGPEHDPVAARARAFVEGMQAKDLTEPSLNGGFGYGPSGAKRQHPDLSNTVMALEALYHADKRAATEELRGKTSLDWEAAIGFVQRCQNLPSHNPEKWASDDPANRGGFVYFPGHSMAGEVKLDSGKTALRSYGSMSYAGLLSYIYADMKPDDPRVKAALEWLQRNYSVEENPGMGRQGLFYYYHLMSKALALAGVKTLTLADGSEADWRRDLALKLLSLQRADGSWVNEEGRWMESDPVLVTAYSVLALDLVHWAM